MVVLRKRTFRGPAENEGAGNVMKFLSPASKSESQQLAGSLNVMRPQNLVGLHIVHQGSVVEHRIDVCRKRFPLFGAQPQISLSDVAAYHVNSPFEFLSDSGCPEP